MGIEVYSTLVLLSYGDIHTELGNEVILPEHRGGRDAIYFSKTRMRC